MSINPVHRIAARLRFRKNPRGLGWGGKRWLDGMDSPWGSECDNL